MGDVYKRYKGKRVERGSKDYDKATWYVRKRIGGVPLHQSIPEARSRKAAQEVADKLIADAKARKYGLRREVSFKEFAEGTYLTYCEQHNQSYDTKVIFVTQFVKFFGSRPLHTITPQDCRDYQWQRLNTPLKNKAARKTSSVNRETNALGRLFTLACEEELLSESPMRYVRKLKNPKPRRRSLTDKQKQALWLELEKDSVLLRIVVLALNLPLRRGQILAIEPAHCDFENKVLLAAPSKGKDVRDVPMNDTVAFTLQSMIADGQIPLPFQRFEKRWHAALIEAGINKEGGTRDENFHFHDLRHVFGSDLIKNGVNPYVVKELFGHSDMRTSSIYMTADPGDMADAVRRLDVQEIGGVN